MKTTFDELINKRILVVDDELDIIDLLKELLDVCEIDQASDFESALNKLQYSKYDAAILDIMGVRGYDLLEVTREKGIPTIVLTAHALSSKDFVKSIRGGAEAYIPKDHLSDIPTFLADTIEGREGKQDRKRNWLDRLDAFFEEKFGADWREKQDPEFWSRYFYT